MAPPFKVAEFDIMFSEGISKEGSLIDVATTFGIIKKSGAWYEFNGVKLGQGREAVKAFLKEDRKVFTEIDKKTRSEMSTKGGDITKVGGDVESPVAEETMSE
jgi:recombination protein RecA